MSGKLKDYQVLDVFCGGTFYKVRHKVTNNLFAWKAYNCCAHTDEQIQKVVNEVNTIRRASSDNLLRYYDSILHAPTKTLYFVLEYVSWLSLQDLLEECKATDKHFAEKFIWLLLHELARASKAVADLSVAVLRKCISPASVFVSDKGEFRINCFEWATGAPCADLMHQAGELVRTLCFLPGTSDDKIKEFHYSEDLQDVVSFLTEDRSSALRPDVVLYHPTVLTNLETLTGPICVSDVLIASPPSVQYSVLASEVNKCDSEKVGELCKVVEPLPRTIFNVGESPIYCNISPKRKFNSGTVNSNLSRDPLSPTLAALALELPGFVPRSRKPYSDAMEVYSRPKLVSEETFSQEWMSRLVALRRREESLNERERDLIAKEIVNSPNAKVIALNDSQDLLECDSNGITLPRMMAQAPSARREGGPRRRPRRPGSLRPRARRKSYGYEELDSSLSADAGDGSIIITATKFTKENMPRRNIFPEVSTKKVHFTPINPFVESDESVTLTYYELDNVNEELAKQQSQKEINKFKYLDLEKITSEKRSAMNWCHSSPSKQAKITNTVFTDISNQSGLRKTPSKSSLTSNSSRFSMMSAKSHWSMESSISKVSDSNALERTRSSVRQSLAQTPVAPPDVKKKTRKSLIPFKTPFKFMSKS